MYAWVREHAAEERKPKDTEEQFIYKARKKAIGPFKQRMWSIGDGGRAAIGQSLEERFTFLMQQLKIDDTAGVVARSCGCRRRRSIATRRSSPPAARSRPRRRRPKGSPTNGTAELHVSSPTQPCSRQPTVIERVQETGQVVAKPVVRAAEREVVPRECRPASNSAISQALVVDAQRAADRGRRVDDDDRRAARDRSRC